LKREEKSVILLESLIRLCSGRKSSSRIHLVFLPPFPSLPRVSDEEGGGGGGGAGPTTGNLTPTNEHPAVTAKHPTTTAELTRVLGKTFHAHSCAAKTASTPPIGTPARHSRNGVAQTIYT
jgi:hypothetical protein